VTVKTISDKENPMSDPIVYRSEDARVLTAWKGACEAITEYVRQTQAVLDAAGLTGRPVYRSTGAWSWGEVRGIGLGDDGAPDGWRVSPGAAYAVPNLRTAAGRKVRDALKAIKHPGEPVQKLPGMPANVITGMSGMVRTPDVRVLGEAVWAEWDTDPEKCEMSFSGRSTAVDYQMWERVKLSEYYAAREAAAA
jgi:hypothetical protein